jgi:hypothetical protein
VRSADMVCRAPRATPPAPDAWSSSGNSSQPSKYSNTPAPPQTVATTNATRTSTGSMAYRRAIAAATPAILRSLDLR